MGGDKDSLINEGKGKNKPKGCKAKVITPHLPQAATATSHPQTTHFSEEEEKVWTLYECFLPIAGVLVCFQRCFRHKPKPGHPPGCSEDNCLHPRHSWYVVMCTQRHKSQILELTPDRGPTDGTGRKIRT